MSVFVRNFLAFLATVVAVTSQQWSPVHIVPGSQIRPGTHGVKSTLGEVYGTRPCDGAGHLVQWRVEGCDETTYSPCKFPANETIHRSEVDFIPSADIEQLGIRLTISYDGKQSKVVYEKPVLNSTVKAGKQYTSKAAGGVSENLKGKLVTVQYILYRPDTEEKTAEICAEADFEMV